MRALTPVFAGLALLFAVGCSGNDAGSGDWDFAPRTADYPVQNIGTRVGSVLADHSFKTGEGADFSLDANVFKAGAKALVIATAAEWCTACREEAPKLQALYDDYRSRGLELVTTLFETADFEAVEPRHAAAWAQLYSTTYPVVADGPFVMQAYYDPQLTPMIMVVDVQTMEIKSITTGFVEADVRALLDILL
ncbi:MAG: TlpA family protein disulfide reductase [Myxococcales bacterium]|nr:TlpA family protein disulfide reductase [Myxococcales bacterium]MCB9525574.1 TlpA family protein disulfide reductase [Myxococcales bacterium]